LPIDPLIVFRLLSFKSSTCLWFVPDTLRQVFFFKSKADAVMPRIGQFIHPRDHAEDE
jgi:hypothetical protein